MKSLFILTSALLFTANVLAENDPLWMRYPAISPNGETIAFTYKGDIYTVPANGGKATQLTTHPAHDTRPIWSPDGSKIAFASDRNGNFDIFIMDMEGGSPKQLTTHSANEYPETFSDAKHILYSAAIQQDAKDSQFPSGQFPQIYRIGINGGRPELYSSLAMESLALNKKGDKLLYQDKKGYEDPWRKHHQSSITRDIWLCTLDREHSFQKITSFKGEDRNPVWATDGSSFYYLSEEKGSFNIFKNDLTGRNSRQITNHTMHPVRFLTSDNNGNLCYGYDGEIYTVKEGTQPKKVDVQIISDKVENDLIHQLKASGATDIAVSPNGKRSRFYRARRCICNLGRLRNYQTNHQHTAAGARSRFQPRRTLIGLLGRTGRNLGRLSKQLGTQERQIFHIRTGIERRTVGSKFADLFPADVFSGRKGSRFLGKPYDSTRD